MKQPKRNKKGYKYLFLDEHGEFYLVLRVEDKLFISDYKTYNIWILDTLFEKWIKCVEENEGYKIKIYGDSRYKYNLKPNDELYKVVRARLKLKEIEGDFK